MVKPECGYLYSTGSYHELNALTCELVMHGFDLFDRFSGGAGHLPPSSRGEGYSGSDEIHRPPWQFRG